MGQIRTEIRRAFITAPADAVLDGLMAQLQERGVEAVTAYELPAIGLNFHEHILRTMRDVDLVRSSERFRV